MKGTSVRISSDVPVALASTVADREGHLYEKFLSLSPLVSDRFSGVAIVATETTAPSLLKLFDDLDVPVIRRSGDGDPIGRHRREAVGLALDSFAGAQHIMYCDLDHLLRWIENDPGELAGVLRRAGTVECLVIGRGPKSWEALPRRLAETEAIVNEIYGLITGRRWDLMMAARLLSRGAAEIIRQHSKVDTVGNDVDWPLLCESRGLSLDHVEAEGLTYKTDADYARDLEDKLDGDPRAWSERMRYSWHMVEAMAPYICDAAPVRPPRG